MLVLKDYNIVDDENNIIDVIWGENKPKYKKDPVIILPVEYTGMSALEKYKIVAEEVNKEIQQRETMLLNNKNLNIEKKKIFNNKIR